MPNVVDVPAVLVVDDDERILRSLSRTRRWRAMTATSVVDALRIASEERPEAAIVDLDLGRESGIELVDLLRSADPTMTIIVLTALRSSYAGFAATQAGADLVLDKPATLEVLAEHIYGIGERPRPLSLRARTDDCIARVLDACEGNKSEAARRLEIPRYSLQRILAKRPAARFTRRQRSK